MAAAVSNIWKLPEKSCSENFPIPKIKGISRGREQTRREFRLSSGIPTIDSALDGGIVRGRISEIIGPLGSGRTSLAASFMSMATRRGEVAAWLDLAGRFDPATMEAAGVDLSRVLWVKGGGAKKNRETLPRETNFFKAAEVVLETGGFGLVALDFDNRHFPLPLSVAIRIARRAERSHAAVMVLAARGICGTFAALSLALARNRARFIRQGMNAPVLFDGFTIKARVARNKLGGSGAVASWQALFDPAGAPISLGDARDDYFSAATERSNMDYHVLRSA